MNDEMLKCIKHHKNVIERRNRRHYKASPRKQEKEREHGNIPDSEELPESQEVYLVKKKLSLVVEPTASDLSH